jgi:ketosteroid isomerase-like protein
MGEHSRDEIEQAYAHYRATAAEAGASGQWDAWADLFTEDAVYIEHLYGRFEGREAIRQWISSTMAEPLNREMTDFPADWWVIDEDRGWVVCAVWNRMQDIGDGELHQAINWSLLKYAGDNQWSYEEDIYNVSEFADMIKGYLDAKKS